MDNANNAQNPILRACTSRDWPNGEEIPLRPQKAIFSLSGKLKTLDGTFEERVGKKTEQSLRRVLLPTAVLPFLPKAIKGPLFVSSDADPADAASKKLNRFLGDCGSLTAQRLSTARTTVRKIGCVRPDVRRISLGYFGA